MYGQFGIFTNRTGQNLKPRKDYDEIFEVLNSLWRNEISDVKYNVKCLLEVTPHTNLQVLKVIPHISLQVRITNKPSCSGNWIECHEITCNCFLKNYSSEALKIELVLKVVWSLYSKIRIYRECIIVNIIVIPKDDEKPLSYSICHAGVF